MPNQKSLLTYLAQAVDQYHTDRQAHTTPEPSTQPQNKSRILRWLIPNGGTLLIVAILLLTQSLWARPFAAPNAPGPSATTVNYQGRLADDAGIPLTGSYGMSFALYDAAEGGTLIWGPESHTAVPVSEGLFSVGLGSQTSGGIPTTTWNGDRYLEITVGGETLAPRELIRSVPIAGMALTVPDGAIDTAQIADGAITTDKLSNDALPYPISANDTSYIVVGEGQTVDISTWNFSDVPAGDIYLSLRMSVRSTALYDASISLWGYDQRISVVYPYSSSSEDRQQLVMIGVIEDFPGGTLEVRVQAKNASGSGTSLVFGSTNGQDQRLGRQLAGIAGLQP